jgi:hypothetical protein
MCPVGKFQSAYAQGECVQCASGLFQEFEGQGQCSECPTGKFQAKTGQGFCRNIPAGMSVKSETKQETTMTLEGVDMESFNTEEVQLAFRQQIADQLGIAVGLVSLGNITEAANRRLAAVSAVRPYGSFGSYGHTPAQAVSSFTFTVAVHTSPAAVFSPVPGIHGSFGSYSGLAQAVLSFTELVMDLTTMASMIQEVYTMQNLAVPGVTVSATPPTMATLVVELVCPAGKYFPAGTESSECLECLSGKHQEFAGKSFCTAHGMCIAGQQEQHGPNRSADRACGACPVGKFSAGSNAPECTQCPFNKYQLNTSQPFCNTKVQCTPGQFEAANTSMLDLRCLPCPVGKYSRGTNAQSCDQCTVGKFQTEPGQPFCEVCGANQVFNDNTGECECAASYYFCPKDATKTQGDCGNAKSSDDEKQKHRGACISCGVFADGADCSTAGSTLANLKTKQGFWRATSATAVFHKCDPLRPDDCKGGMLIEPSSTGSYTSFQQKSQSRDSQCREGRTGPLCSACDTSKQFVRKFEGSCGTCSPGEGEGMLLAGPVVLFMLAITVPWLRKRGYVARARAGLKKRTIKLRILYGFEQVLTRMAPSYNLVLPPAVAQFFNALSFLEVIDISSLIGNASCLYMSNFITKVYMTTAAALLFLACLALWYTYAAVMWALYADGDGKISCAELRSWFCSKPTAKAKQAQSPSMVACTSAALFFTFLIYPSMSSLLFNALGCTWYEDDKRYLTIDMSISCADADYLQMQAWAVTMIFVFVLGFPVAYYCMLSRHRAALNPTPASVQQRRDARTMGTEVWGQQQRENDPTIQHLAFLWGGYKPQLWWFEVFEMTRKFLMTALPIALALVLDDSKFLTMAYGLLVTVLTTAVHAIGDPYLSQGDSLLLLPAQFELFLSLVSGVVTEFAKGTDAEEGAQTGMTILVLTTGVPITLCIVYSCICPDAADRLLAFRRQKLAHQLVEKMKEVSKKMGLAALFEDAGSADSEPSMTARSAAAGLPPLSAGQLDEALGGTEKGEGDITEENTDWANIEHGLLTMSSSGVLQAAIDDPAGHVVCLVKTVAISKLKAKAEPHLAGYCLDWDADIMPLLEQVDSAEELRQAAADPHGFMLQLLVSSGCNQLKQEAVTRLADELLAQIQGKTAAGAVRPRPRATGGGERGREALRAGSAPSRMPFAATSPSTSTPRGHAMSRTA